MVVALRGDGSGGRAARDGRRTTRGSAAREGAQSAARERRRRSRRNARGSRWTVVRGGARDRRRPAFSGGGSSISHRLEHAAATDILSIQLDDLRKAARRRARRAERRGIPLPVEKEAGGIGIGLAMNASGAGSSRSGPAYAQVVAAMERARSDAAVARKEIVQRRKDLATIKQERNAAVRERRTPCAKPLPSGEGKMGARAPR